MPRRELLTAAQRFQLFAFPDDESELIRLATLSTDDFAFVRQHRGGHNRVGIAVLMVYLRFPGRVLGPAEKPLTAPLTPAQRTSLDQLLSLMPERPVSKLAWLRQSPGEPSAKGVLAHIERLQAIRGLGLPPDIGHSVHQNRLLRLAREGGQTAVYQIEEYETDRRHATLVAILLDTAATLTDEILNLHDRLIGSFFTKAKHKYEKRFAAEGKAVNDKVRLYAKVGAALIAAKEAGTDPFQAIEAIVPWKLLWRACTRPSNSHATLSSIRPRCSWTTTRSCGAIRQPSLTPSISAQHPPVRT